MVGGDNLNLVMTLPGETTLSWEYEIHAQETRRIASSVDDICFSCVRYEVNELALKIIS